MSLSTPNVGYHCEVVAAICKTPCHWKGRTYHTWTTESETTEHQFFLSVEEGILSRTPAFNCGHWIRSRRVHCDYKERQISEKCTEVFASERSARRFVCFGNPATLPSVLVGFPWILPDSHRPHPCAGYYFLLTSEVTHDIHTQSRQEN